MKMEKWLNRSPEGTPGGPAPQVATVTGVPVPTPPVPVVPGPQGFQQQTVAPQHPSSTEAQLATALDALKEEQGRRSGLDKQNREYDERIGKMETQLTGIAESLTKLTTPEPPPAQGNAPAPEGNKEGEQANQMQVLMDKVTAMETAAQQQVLASRRDDLIAEMSAQGQPGEGLNLIAFRANIPVVEDEAAQKQEIEAVINNVKGVVGASLQETSDALARGATLGSSPPPAGEQSELEEAQALHVKLNDPVYLSQTEKGILDKELARYDDLMAKYGSAVSKGFSTPWTRLPEMSQMISRLEGQIHTLSEKAGLPFQMGG